MRSCAQCAARCAPSSCRWTPTAPATRRCQSTHRAHPGAALRSRRRGPMHQAHAGSSQAGEGTPIAADDSNGARTRLKLLLYDDPHSEYCAKVKVALLAKGLQWQPLPAKPCGGGGRGGGGGDSDGGGFQPRAPLGKIPALVVMARAAAGPSAATTASSGRGGGAGGDATGQRRGAEPGAAVAGGAAEEVQGDEGDAWREAAVLFESEVINEWLEEQFPDPPLLPRDPLERAKARLVSRFHDLYLEPALRRLYPLVRPEHTGAAPPAARDAATELYARLAQLEGLLAQPARGSRGGGGNSDAGAAEASSGGSGMAEGGGAAADAGGSGGGGGGGCYAVGRRLSLADCGYPGLLLYAELLLPLLGLGPLDYGAAGLPRVGALRAALWGDPHVRAVLDELAPAAQEWVDSKMGRGA